MADSTLLPPSVLFVDTDIDAEAKRVPERKLWKFEGRRNVTPSSICPLYNALVDNKYRIREQVLTLDQPHAYFWNAVDIEMPEGRNQVLLQTFRPQHDLGGQLGKEAADKMVRNQLDTCARHKAQFDKFARQDDEGWEFLASTLQSTNASDPRGRRILLVAPRRSASTGAITYDKNNEISSRIHYIARDLCTERILCTSSAGGGRPSDDGGDGSVITNKAHQFSKPVAQYFINHLVKATRLCHKCKIFGVVPPPDLRTAQSASTRTGTTASEILLFRQQGCYHLKLMLGDTAEIIEGDDQPEKLRRLQAQDLNFIALIYRNILAPKDAERVEEGAEDDPAPAAATAAAGAGVLGGERSRPDSSMAKSSPSPRSRGLADLGACEEYVRRRYELSAPPTSQPQPLPTGVGAGVGARARAHVRADADRQQQAAKAEAQDSSVDSPRAAGVSSSSSSLLFERFMKPQAILEMEEALNHEMPNPVLLPAKKDMSAVRDHIKDLVRDEFRAFQKLEETGAGSAAANAGGVDDNHQLWQHRIHEAIRLWQLPPLPKTVETRDAVDRCLCAARQTSDTTVEMVVLVAPREPMESSDPHEHNPNQWPDMIVRFRLTKQVPQARGRGDGRGGADADADAGSPRQVSTQTKIEAWYMSGQTIDAWNSFKYALNSKLLKKSSKEIKRDMLVNTDKLLSALKKAIETPDTMEIDDINGLTAHIACMMAYTQAVEKGDAIRQAVGNFHKRFDTAWSLRGIPDDCDDWRLEPLKDTSKGGLLMQKEHRQQLVQLVRDEGRKRKFDQDHYALQYKHDEVMAAIAQKTTGSRGAGVGGSTA